MWIVLFKIKFFSAFAVCCHRSLHCTVLHCAVANAATGFSTACCCWLIVTVVCISWVAVAVIVTGHCTIAHIIIAVVATV